VLIAMLILHTLCLLPSSCLSALAGAALFEVVIYS
jgi:hypothetical protein